MEHQNVEYQIVWRNEYLKWICGFANAFGGLSATFRRKTTDDYLEKTVVKIFNLRERHFFRRIGPNKGGRWEVVEHAKSGEVG
jgi:hypothetical protein